jgi:hypothetical protein
MRGTPHQIALFMPIPPDAESGTSVEYQGVVKAM